jgi:hypothetical protein
MIESGAKAQKAPSDGQASPSRKSSNTAAVSATPSSDPYFEFIGADSFKLEDIYKYAVSVPWRKLKTNEVLLAWEMNDKSLPRIHGFPLPTVVFGYIGAKSCKWQCNWEGEYESGAIEGIVSILEVFVSLLGVFER